MIQLGGVTPKARWSMRLVAAASLAVLLVGVLAIKLAELQLTEGARLAGMAHANTVHRVVLEADRGIIYDRHGEPLVTNSPTSSLEVVPAELPLDARARAVELAELARITGRPEPEVAAILEAADPYSSVRFSPDLSQAQELALNERLPQLPGASIAQRAVRTYVDPLVFGHVVGYVGPLNETDLKRLGRLGYQPGEVVGKVGVEAGLETLLRGTNGWADVEVDARGQVVRTLDSQAPVPGDSVYLSLDASLQRATAQSLAAGLVRDGKRPGPRSSSIPEPARCLRSSAFPVTTPTSSRTESARPTTAI